MIRTEPGTNPRPSGRGGVNIDLDTPRAESDLVVDNSGGLSLLASQTNELLSLLERAAMSGALRIGVDLDGVIYPFIECLAAWARANGYPDSSPDTWHGHYGGYEGWGMDTAAFEAAMSASVRDGHLFSSQPLERADLISLSSLADAGHELHVVTARTVPGHDGLVQQATHAWLDATGIPFASVTFSEDKTTVPVHTFIEDNLRNYDALEAAGHRPWLITRDWNRDTDRERRRVESVAQFATLVLSGQAL